MVKHHLKSCICVPSVDCRDYSVTLTSMNVRRITAKTCGSGMEKGLETISLEKTGSSDISVFKLVSACSS